MEARDRLGLEERILDVAYEDVRTRPIEVARIIYSRAGFPMTDEAEAAMLRWEQENRQGKHGLHEYSLEQFGLSERMIEEELSEYMSRFARYI